MMPQATASTRISMPPTRRPRTRLCCSSPGLSSSLAARSSSGGRSISRRRNSRMRRSKRPGGDRDAWQPRSRQRLRGSGLPGDPTTAPADGAVRAGHRQAPCAVGRLTAGKNPQIPPCFSQKTRLIPAPRVTNSDRWSLGIPKVIFRNANSPGGTRSTH